MKRKNSLCARVVNGQLQYDGQLNGPRGVLATRSLQLQGQFIIGLPIMKGHDKEYACKPGSPPDSVGFLASSRKRFVPG